MVSIPPSPQGMLPALDTIVVERLKELMGSEFANTLECYLTDSQAQLAAITAAIASDNYSAVARCAHALKSTSDTVGAGEFRSLLARIEAHPRSPGHWADLRLLAAAAQESFERVRPMIRELIERDTHGFSAIGVAR